MDKSKSISAETLLLILGNKEVEIFMLRQELAKLKEGAEGKPDKS